MDASGVWDQRYDEIDDLARARRLPSPQLVGTPERATLDLNALSALGVELVGRWAAVRDGVRAVLRRTAQRLLARRPEDGPPARHLRRLGARRRTRRRCQRRRERFDAHGVPALAALAARSAQRRDPDDPVGDRIPPRLPLARRAGARRARASFGTTAASSTSPGLYALGLPVLRRRKSTFIHGIEDDAREVIGELGSCLDGSRG